MAVAVPPRKRTTVERPESPVAHIGVGGGVPVTLCGYIPTRRGTLTEARRRGICGVCAILYFEQYGKHADTRGRA